MAERIKRSIVIGLAVGAGSFAYVAIAAALGFHSVNDFFQWGLASGVGAWIALGDSARATSTTAEGGENG